jgi:hypothetical protein
MNKKNPLLGRSLPLGQIFAKEKRKKDGDEDSDAEDAAPMIGELVSEVNNQSCFANILCVSPN